MEAVTADSISEVPQAVFNVLGLHCGEPALVDLAVWNAGSAVTCLGATAGSGTDARVLSSLTPWLIVFFDEENRSKSGELLGR